MSLQYQSEVTDINKQKFLAELGKLLTFMYEEDRLDALALYEDLFDSCADEQQLIHHLISPTRQAVVLARTYNAKERMLSVQSQSRSDLYDDDFEAVPAFILAIENIRSEAPGLFTDRPAVDNDQFSLFAGETVEEAEIVEDTVEETSPAEVEDEVVVLESEALSTETAEADEKDFFSEAEILEDVTPVYDDGEDPRFGFRAPRRQAAEGLEDDRLRDLASRHRPRREAVQYKRVVALLILYIIFAVPITLAVVALLLIPTVLSLVLSLGFVAAGVSALGCAFGSFAIFADILVVLGASLILLALGLFFFWLFVWFIGGAIAGFVNGVIRLGDKFSSKEVSA